MKKYKIAIFLLLVVGLLVFLLLFLRRSTPTLDRPDYYPTDSAVPFLTMKWLNNIKFAKKGLLTNAKIQTANEGKVVQISFKHGEINVDKASNINYPFVARIELENPINKKKETLYFSKIRYEKAQIFRTGNDGIINKTNWGDISVGDTAKIEENINLLVSNIDRNSKFTDNYVISLIIHLK